MKNPKLLIGLHRLKNDIVYIDEVENGESCNCVCLGCNDNLIAKNNLKNINRHHFAHKTKDCGYSNESALHKLAKQLLRKQNFIVLPPLTSKSITIIKKSKIYFDKILIEDQDNITLGSHTNNTFIKPDCIAFKNNEKLIIEIKVTHKVDDEKLEKIKKLNISTIEIDFSDAVLSRNRVNEILSTSIKSKWIHNSKEQKLLNKALERYDGYRIIEIGYSSKNIKFIKCPKFKEDFVAFKKTTFYNNSLVQKISTGAHWNRIFYEKKLPAKIYVDGCKIEIEPTIEELNRHIDHLTMMFELAIGTIFEEEYYSWLIKKKELLEKELYSPQDRIALGELKKISKNKSISQCVKCDYYKTKAGDFVICKFK